MHVSITSKRQPCRPTTTGTAVAWPSNIRARPMPPPSARRTVIASRSAFPTLGPSDLQAATVQTNYNWDCCGVAFEYSRSAYAPTISQENSYRFSFSLSNVGTFRSASGNRADQLQLGLLWRGLRIFALGLCPHHQPGEQLSLLVQPFQRWDLRHHPAAAKTVLARNLRFSGQCLTIERCLW